MIWILDIRWLAHNAFIIYISKRKITNNIDLSHQQWAFDLCKIDECQCNYVTQMDDLVDELLNHYQFIYQFVESSSWSIRLAFTFNHHATWMPFGRSSLCDLSTRSLSFSLSKTVSGFVFSIIANIYIFLLLLLFGNYFLID